MVDSLCRKCGVKNGAHAPNCPDYERAEAGPDETGDAPPSFGPARFWVFVRERMEPYVVASAEDLARAFADARAENIPSALTSGYRVRTTKDVTDPPPPRPYGIDWDTTLEVYEVGQNHLRRFLAPEKGPVLG